MKNAVSIFRMPAVSKITGRSSSITNAFINAIIPAIQPTEADIAEALSILGMTTDKAACAYCGDTLTEWDHLRPLVKNQRPTGYITEIQNLVPACGKCNQSKGNKDWRDWIVSSAPRSPASRRKTDLENRIKHLDAYECWRKPTQVDFNSVIGAFQLEAHWKNWQSILEKLKEAQRHADSLLVMLRNATDPK